MRTSDDGYLYAQFSMKRTAITVC